MIQEPRNYLQNREKHSKKATGANRIQPPTRTRKGDRFPKESEILFEDRPGTSKKASRNLLPKKGEFGKASFNGLPFQQSFSCISASENNGWEHPNVSTQKKAPKFKVIYEQQPPIETQKQTEKSISTTSTNSEDDIGKNLIGFSIRVNATECLAQKEPQNGGTHKETTFFKPKSMAGLKESSLPIPKF